MSFEVDAVVERLYRCAKEDPASPPGIGPLVRSLCEHRVHLYEWQAEESGWQRIGVDAWNVYVTVGATPGERGNAIADMLACREVASAYGYAAECAAEHRELAEAIVLPTPAARGWAAELAPSEIAATLVTTSDLVERRLRIAGVRSSTKLAIVPSARVFSPDFSVPRPLAKVSRSEGIVDLDRYRSAHVGVGLGRIRKT